MRKVFFNTKEGTTAEAVWLIVKRTILSDKDLLEPEGVAPPGDLAKQLQEFLESQQASGTSSSKGNGKGF